MSTIYVIIGILSFGVMIGIHELGHFTAAKICNVKVNEFAIGMGPAIFKKQRGETLYALRCIPFGGYCALEGEDSETGDDRAFSAQPLIKKLFILVAGSFNNFLLGLLIVIILYSNATGFLTPVILDVREDCPYRGEYGILPGDRFLRIDGHRVFEYYDVTDFLAEGDGTHDIVLRRDGRRVRLDDFEFVPVQYPDLDTPRYGFSVGYEKATFFSKITNSWDSCMEFARMVWMSLGEIFKGHVTIDDVSGPVGIVDMMAETGESSESVSEGMFNVFFLVAFISVNLAVMNMLPIPAVDGGRVFLLIVSWIIEKIIGRKLNPKYESYINAAGLVLLLAFMGFIMLKDIIRLFRP